MRALGYLEWRHALHAIAAIRRSPGRLALWIPYGLLLFSTLFSRAHGRGYGPSITDIAPNVATGIAGLYIALVGSAFAAGAGGRIATFRSPAEAVMMCNAGLAPLAVTLWLQLRHLIANSTRVLGSFAFAFVILAPHRPDLAATARALVAAMFVIAVPIGAELPAFLVARGRLGSFVRNVALTFVVCGIVIAVVGFAGGEPWRNAVSATHVDPGIIITAILSSDPRTIVIPAVFLAVFATIVAALGGDAVPELYAASQGRFALLQRAQNSRLVVAARVVRGDGSARVPPGPLALVWKDWLGFRRGLGVTLLLWGATFWALCGAAAAYATIRFGDDAPLVTIFVCAALGVLFWAPMSASNGLADELAKPLFWLAHASLRTRLAAWTLGRALRGGTALALGPIAAASVAGHATPAIAALPFTLVSYWSLQALGIGLYAIFPSPLDARGPIGPLRLLASVAYLAPAAALAIAILALHGAALLATFGFALVLGIEGWVVIELCALRFAEYGASIGRVARAL